MTNQTIGIIGVGEIAEAIVTGLSNTADPPTVNLSPRGATTARRLAANHSHVRVCRDNHDVVDGSDVILLTVGPASTRDALDGLRIPSDRTVVSAVAGVSLAELRAFAPDAPTVVRVIPLPAVRTNTGVTAIFPGHDATEKLFGSLGDVVVAQNEDQFSALSAATGSMSTFVGYVSAVSTWLARQGFTQTEAESFARGMLGGVGSALSDRTHSLADLVTAHETPGGLNAAFREDWLDARNRAHLDQALDRILDRVRSPHDARHQPLQQRDVSGPEFGK